MDDFSSTFGTEPSVEQPVDAGTNESQVSIEEIDRKLREFYDGKIVRKDLTKHIKEGANVPTYVLEYLLGQYCNSDDDAIIQRGVETVKSILANNYVRPDESQKVLSQLRQKGSHTIIDMVTVSLNMRDDVYEASFSNLGLTRIPISEEYPEQYDRLLCGGIWCIVQLEYGADGPDDFGIVDMDGAELRSKKSKQKDMSPISIRKLTPIQMPTVDMDQLKEGRKHFSKDEWLDVLLRSTGMEPTELTYREKWLLLTRMIPLVENNFNLCELGPRSTGKSHLYKEVSPNSILVSGGQTTVANLFYNMGRKTMGLVGLWDVVAFDEVAGINFKDKDGIQIMKDYMASGSFARGKEEKAASASMVFVGNINQSVDVLLKTSSLFDPFPPEMGTDTAFLDRIHCYNPGWEIPKFRPEHFTNDYGFITDYLSGWVREMRKVQYGDAIDKYFRLGKNLNQRDTIAVRRLVDGYTKLLYPDGEFTKDDIQEILTISLEMRRRVKEQLKKLGGMEFYDVNFSYIDMDDMSEHYVSVPEQGGGKLIPEGMCNPGQVYTVSHGKSDMIGVFRLESQMLPGSGKFDKTGLGSDRECKESVDTAFNFLKANGNRISGSISAANKDYIINYQDLQGLGMTKTLALPTLVALCSIALQRPVQSSMVILGDFSIGGTILKVENLASTLQVCLDSGAKKVLLPAATMMDLATVPPDLMSAFQLVPYSDPADAVFKALGVE
jgi:ATP-dependent Lon protease